MEKLPQKYHFLLNYTSSEQVLTKFCGFRNGKILYEDEVDISIKNELLIILEEYGHHGIDEESIDQITTSLLDIFHQSGDTESNWSFGCQLLITCTSLLIQLDQLESGVCTSLVTELVALISSRVNQPDSRRIRSCACQCLKHLEEFHPGLLFAYHGDFARLTRQERTDVFQDYALLTSKVIESVGLYVENGELKSPSYLDAKKSMSLQKQISLEPQDFRQTAAYIIESSPLFTRSGSYHITQSLSRLVNALSEVSPMIFKPFMLQQMSSMSCIHFHTLINLQREFEGEILSDQEEADLLHRLVRLVNHPSIIPSKKLLVIQWTQYYLQSEPAQSVPVIHHEIVSKHRLEFYPSVFDSLSCQLAKLYMTSLCGNTDEDKAGIETSILLGSLGCLHKLVWHTGSARAAVALFRALFFFYKKHNGPSFSKDIQRFVRGLISEFPHFIPHSIDFMERIKTSYPESPVYLETLSLIHKQVVMATEDQIVNYFQYYLQIMKKAAMEKEIWQNQNKGYDMLDTIPCYSELHNEEPTLMFLQYIAEHAAEIDDSSWKLGHSILEICRNLLIYHGTELYYTDIGDVLFYIMTEYEDIDVQDKARFYYALMTGAADKKMHHVLQDTVYGAQSMSQALSTILPGNVEKKNLAKIIHLDSPVFTWERIQTSSSSKEINSEEFNNGTSMVPDKGDLKTYYEFLNKTQTSVDLTFKLLLMSKCEFDKVHAVTIHVVSDNIYHNIPDIHVACIYKNDTRNIVISLCPKLPLPHTFHASVVFAGDQKQTYSCKLPNIDLEFSNLLLTLPWKQCTGSDAIGFFNESWDWILQPTQPERKANKKSYDPTHDKTYNQTCVASRDSNEPVHPSTRIRPFAKGVKSVKLLETTMSELQSVIQANFTQYVIHNSREIDEKVIRLGMFLPPHYHILMKCQCHQDGVLVTIVTDLWNILTHVNKYIESWVKS